RYSQTREWAVEHRLDFAAVGLDIEPDLNLAQQFFRAPVRTAARCLARVWSDAPRLEIARERYAELVACARADGYRVESYQWPLIADERRAQTRVLQRVSGMLDVAVDREVLMLYTTLMLPRGPAGLWSYAPAAQAIGVGSTGGGIDEQPKLTWEELVRDLLI